MSASEYSLLLCSISKWINTIFATISQVFIKRSFGLSKLSFKFWGSDQTMLLVIQRSIETDIQLHLIWVNFFSSAKSVLRSITGLSEDCYSLNGKQNAFRQNYSLIIDENRCDNSFCVNYWTQCAESGSPSHRRSQSYPELFTHGFAQYIYNLIQNLKFHRRSRMSEWFVSDLKPIIVFDSKHTNIRSKTENIQSSFSRNCFAIAIPWNYLMNNYIRITKLWIIHVSGGPQNYITGEGIENEWKHILDNSKHNCFWS